MQDWIFCWMKKNTNSAYFIKSEYDELIAHIIKNDSKNLKPNDYRNY